MFSFFLRSSHRFDLQELQQLCELHQDAATLGDEEDYTNVNNQIDQAFVELLRSMWNKEDEDNEGTDTDEGRDEEKGLKEDHRADDLTAVEREIGEEKVNEEELEEIYEFAATQKKREERRTAWTRRKKRRCPPPNTSNLPVPGRSPGQAGDWGTDAADLDEPKESLHLKQESQGPRSICVPLSPDSPQIKKEPELLVLSDSSKGMEVVLSSRSPSPHSPHVVQKQQSYTQIIPQPILKFDEPTKDNKKFRSLEFSPDDRSAAVNKCDQSPVDCSPEVSWLIPSTPLQHRRSMTSSSST
ncbi:hypothetical protein D5F01_LYC05578 [Larimichthys crocea]|uniref:Uncharacterized protein n=1 Tax=Larimichthys crocea TaxID=215358 RepID=A0A6G0J010_LARCR|nr:hypothetical protein D5F01_LYC05578 [Larimichthys crocea]